MTRLLKADFKRFFKDKLFLIALIIAGAFAISTPLLYKVLFSFLTGKNMSELGMILDVKYMFFAAFSLTNNLGLIAPIFILIIIGKDFSFGTIRNKIIKGHSRISIFLSIFIVSSSIISLIMFSYAAVNGLLTLALFSDLIGKVTAKEVGYFILSLLLELLVLISIAAFISLLATCMKNSGIAIVFYAAIILGSVAIHTALQMAVMFIENDIIVKLIETITLLNVFSHTSIIGLGTTYPSKELFLIILSNLLFIAGCNGLGILVFNKKDLK